MLSIADISYEIFIRNKKTKIRDRFFFYFETKEPVTEYMEKQLIREAY
jgi:hypothetical protein